jgi:hypothetical protein
VAPPVTGGSESADDQASMAPSSERPMLIVTPYGTSIVK